jgi:2-polyprenyl-3-methyl-5-hydroxy-6-metoxy-1,4-benzoquinol methylase
MTETVMGSGFRKLWYTVSALRHYPEYRTTMPTFDPAYYANARREIEPLLPSTIDSVLEIGGGEGNTLLWLRGSKAAAVCRSVELLREAADRAKLKGLDVRVADVEREGAPFAEQFQIVLCLDVLEHLRDP